MASKNEFWNYAKEVWDTIPNENIGRAFVQYWRTLSNFIKEKVTNACVGSRGSMYCGFSRYFKPTESCVVPENKYLSVIILVIIFY